MAAKKGVDLNKLMGMLECSICLERYENPKMLKCAHEFCKPCVEGILEFQPDGSATIQCPLRCQVHTVIGKQETVNDLTASFIAKNVLEAVTTDEEEQSPAQHLPMCNAAADCAKCVAMFCCEHLMCNSCYKIHRASLTVHKRTFRLHWNTRKNALVVTCEKHVSKCTHVCEDGKLMCVYCLHRDPTHKNLCPHAKNNIDGVVTSLRKTLEKEVVRQDKMEMLKTRTLEQVESVKMVYGEKIRARKMELLQQYSDFLDKKEEDHMHNIESLCKNLVSENFGVEGALGKNVLERGIDVEMLIREKELESILETQNQLTLKTLNLSLSDSLGMLHPEGSLGLVGVEYGKIFAKDSPVSTLLFQPGANILDCPSPLSLSNTPDELVSVGAAAMIDEPGVAGKVSKLPSGGANAMVDEPGVAGKVSKLPSGGPNAMVDEPGEAELVRKLPSGGANAMVDEPGVAGKVSKLPSGGPNAMVDEPGEAELVRKLPSGGANAMVDEPGVAGKVSKLPSGGANAMVDEPGVTGKVSKLPSGGANAMVDETEVDEIVRKLLSGGVNAVVDEPGEAEFFRKLLSGGVNAVVDETGKKAELVRKLLSSDVEATVNDPGDAELVRKLLSGGVEAMLDEPGDAEMLRKLLSGGVDAMVDEPGEAELVRKLLSGGAEAIVDERGEAKSVRKFLSGGAEAMVDEPEEAESVRKLSSGGAEAMLAKEFEIKGMSAAVDCQSYNQPTNSASLDGSSYPQFLYSQSPVDCHLLKSRGNEYFKKGKYKEALECYSEAIHHADTNESSAIFYQNRAAANEKLGYWSDVVEDCNKALKADSKYCKALLRRARAYQGLGEKRLAAQDFVRLYSTGECSLQGCTHMNPHINDSTSYHKLMISSIRALCAGDADDIWKNRPMTMPPFALTRTYYSNTSNFDIFATKLNTASAEDKPYVQMLEKLGHYEIKSVVDICTSIIDSHSKHWERASLLRGSLYFLMDEMAISDKDFKRIIQLERTDSNIPLIIDALLRLSDVHNDGYYIDEAMKLDRNNAKIFYWKGRLIMKQKKIIGCLGVPLVPSTDSSSHSNSGFTETEACVNFKLAMALDATYIAPRLWLAECLAQRKDGAHAEEANSVMEETVRLFPENALAWCVYASVLKWQYTSDANAYRIQDALKKLNKSISLDPTDPRPYEYKAEILGGNESVENFQLAMERKSSWALQSMALAQMKRGKIKDTLYLLKAVLEVSTRKSELMNIVCLLEDIDLQTKFGYLKLKRKIQYHHEMNTHSRFLLEMFERIFLK